MTNLLCDPVQLGSGPLSEPTIKKDWDNFLLANNSSFLQSFGWGQMQEKIGRKVFRLKVIMNGAIAAEAQIFCQSTPAGNFLYMPYGPVFNKNLDIGEKDESFRSILSKLSEFGKKEKCFFLRVEPVIELGGVGKIENPFKRFQPQKSLVLSLDKNEDELFRSFSRTTKYNINLSKRKSIKIIRQKGYIDDFYALMQQTRDRQDFGIHGASYYKSILEINEGPVSTELFFAEYESKKINASLVLYFGDTATTLHAGSDYNYRQIKASNLLEWEIIRTAKNEGYKKLDYWGIDEQKWPGLTAFKKGFGGEEIDYPAGFDIVYNKFLYNAYKFIKALKK